MSTGVIRSAVKGAVKEGCNPTGKSRTHKSHKAIKSAVNRALREDYLLTVTYKDGVKEEIIQSLSNKALPVVKKILGSDRSIGSYSVDRIR